MTPVMICFFSCCYLRVSCVELYQHISDSETICDMCIFIIFIVGVNSPAPPYSLCAFQMTSEHVLINGFVDFIVCYELLGIWLMTTKDVRLKNEYRFHPIFLVIFFINVFLYYRCIQGSHLFFRYFVIVFVFKCFIYSGISSEAELPISSI